MSRRVLVVTLPPTTGGVPAKTRILCDFLRRRGHDVTLAHYATLSDDPRLVAPSWRIPFGARPGIAQRTCFDDQRSVAVGCWFPELEFSYYRPSEFWRTLIAGHDRHIAVGGTILVSNLLSEAKVPHMVWCASTMIDDRIDRRRAMPFARRLLDAAVIGPVQRAMERRLLAGSANFMAVSRYAADTLIAAGGASDHMRVVPVPVDTDIFRPPSMPAVTGRIGFAGRPEDPRKNLPLLFHALAELNRGGVDGSLVLTGRPQPALMRLATNLGIADRVTFSGWLDEADLPGFYKSLDVFAFPSAKEGLGISGLQAMACGVPVVSTRCGGPEDFVIPDETGYLSESEPRALAKALRRIIEDRALRDRLGVGARRLMQDKYNLAAFEANIADVWHRTWDEPL